MPHDPFFNFGSIILFLICGSIVACSNVQLCKLDTEKTEETGLDAFEMKMLGCGG